MELSHDKGISCSLQNQALEEMRAGNPAARSLAMLIPVACESANTVAIDYLSGKLLMVSIAFDGDSGAAR